MFYGWEKREFRSAGLPPAAAVVQELFAHRRSDARSKRELSKIVLGHGTARGTFILPFGANSQLGRFLHLSPRYSGFELPRGPLR